MAASANPRGALAFCGFSIALIGAGALFFWKSRKAFDVFAVVTMAFTIPLIFVYLSGTILALAVPIIEVIIGAIE